MRLTHELLSQPHACAVIPGRSKDPEGFVDTGVVAPGWDPYIYVSVAAVKEMGRLIGMVPKAELDAIAEELRTQVAQAKADCEAALAEVERLRPVEDYISNVHQLHPEEPTPDPDPVAA